MKFFYSSTSWIISFQVTQSFFDRYVFFQIKYIWIAKLSAFFVSRPYYCMVDGTDGFLCGFKIINNLTFIFSELLLIMQKISTSFIKSFIKKFQHRSWIRHFSLEPLLKKRHCTPWKSSTQSDKNITVNQESKLWKDTLMSKPNHPTNPTVTWWFNPKI